MSFILQETTLVNAVLVCEESNKELILVDESSHALTLVEGTIGATGTAATVTVGTTTTGAAGTNATVVNVGTTSAAVLDFTIPRGVPGVVAATAPITYNAGTQTVGIDPDYKPNPFDQSLNTGDDVQFNKVNTSEITFADATVQTTAATEIPVPYDHNKNWVVAWHQGDYYPTEVVQAGVLADNGIHSIDFDAIYVGGMRFSADSRGSYLTVSGFGITFNDGTSQTTAATSPDLTPYLLKTEAASTYYPLTNPSGYITSSALSPYLLSSTAASTYYPLSSNPAGYLTSASLSGYATQSWVTSQGYVTSSALAPYLLSSTAASTYETQTHAASTYQTIAGMSGYLTTSAAASTYYPLTNPSAYITASALTPYALISSLGTAAYQNTSYWIQSPTVAATDGQIPAWDAATSKPVWIDNAARTLFITAKNQTGSTIPARSVVYISGATGANPLISLAQANDEATSATTIGITSASIANGATGQVVTSGLLTKVDTSDYPEGTGLYLSATTAGGFTTTLPQAPNHGVYLGVVTRSHANQGAIEVTIKNYQELEEMSDVLITSISAGDVIYRNPANTLWINGTPGAAGLLTTASAASTYLTQANAASTYQPISGMSSYALKASSNTFTANQVIEVTDNTNAALRVTQTGTGEAFRVEDAANPDGSPFVIDASGNVGIGTASIGAKLVVNGGAIFSGISGGSLYNFTQNGTGTLAVFANNATSTADAVRITNLGTGNSFVVEDSTNPDSTPFVITNAGDVGIGTTPVAGYKLYVTGGLTYFGTSAALFQGGLTSRVMGGSTIPLVIDNRGTGASFRVDDDASDTTPFIVDAGGNVGVKTATPAYDLDINGTANLTTLRFADGTTQTTAYTGATNPFDQTLNTTDTVQFGGLSLNDGSGNTGVFNQPNRLELTGTSGLDGGVYVSGSNIAFSLTNGTTTVQMDLSGVTFPDATVQTTAAFNTPSASTTVEGKVELATDAEAIAGTDENKAVTASGLDYAILNQVTWDVTANGGYSASVSGTGANATAQNGFSKQTVGPTSAVGYSNLRWSIYGHTVGKNWNSSFDFSRKYKASVMFGRINGTDANSAGWITIGDGGTIVNNAEPNDQSFGFKVVGSTAYGFVHNGSSLTVSTSSLSGMGNGTFYAATAVSDGLGNVTFNIGGVSFTMTGGPTGTPVTNYRNALSMKVINSTTLTGSALSLVVTKFVVRSY